MARATGYSIGFYGDLIADRRRTGAYVEALRRAVTPGCTVIDLGAGTGIFSMLACRMGASRVYAIEPHHSIELARLIAAANGLSDRITFFRELSGDVDLPAPADVVISDLRGVLPFFEHHLPAIIDVRRRLLADGGRLIPQVDTVWASLAQADALYSHYDDPWRWNDFDLDMSAGHQAVTNIWKKVRLEREQLLAPAQCLATLDYHTVDGTDVAGSLTWEMDRPGTVHGLTVWFDTALDDVARLSNAPGEPPIVYGQGFFPWSQPVEVEPGDVVTVEVQAELTGDDYTWTWCLEHRPAPGSDRESTTFRQSSDLGTWPDRSD